MRNGNNKSSVGSGGTTLLQVMFIGLKLAGVIDWSWWWVMAPTWGTIALVAVLGVVYSAIMAYEGHNA